MDKNKMPNICRAEKHVASFKHILDVLLDPPMDAPSREILDEEGIDSVTDLMSL